MAREAGRDRAAAGSDRRWFLADVSSDFAVVRALRAAGHDVPGRREAVDTARHRETINLT